MVLRSFLASLLLLQIVPQPNTHVGPQPGIIASGGGSCSTVSRTLDGTSQYFVNADGSHAAAEIGANKDFAWAGCFYWDGLTTDRRGLYQNGGTGTAAKGVAVYVYNGAMWGNMADGATLFSNSTGAVAITVGWHCGFLLGDRSGVLETYVDGIQHDTTPANISGVAATDLTNTIALEAGRFGTLFYGYSRIGTPMGLWVGTIGVDVPTIAQLVAQNTTATAPATCADWTVAPTACWPFTGAAGANETDAIGTITLTQVNSPGSNDGPGTGCN